MSEKKRDIDELREMLFRAAERLEGVDGADLDAELLRARAIGDLGKVLVDTARVEVQREIRTGQASSSRFLPPRIAGELSPAPTKQIAPPRPERT